MFNYTLFIETIFVAISVCIIYMFFDYMELKFLYSEKTFNILNNYKNYIKLFLTGIMAHLIFEFTQLNYYYCINGNACQKKIN